MPGRTAGAGPGGDEFSGYLITGELSLVYLKRCICSFIGSSLIQKRQSGYYGKIHAKYNLQNKK
jgi:hypothetical protein